MFYTLPPSINDFKNGSYHRFELKIMNYDIYILYSSPIRKVTDPSGCSFLVFQEKTLMSYETVHAQMEASASIK